MGRTSRGEFPGLSQRIVEEMERRGWTWSHFHEVTDVAASTLHGLREGDPTPDGRTLYRIAKAFGWSIDRLLTGRDTAPSPQEPAQPPVPTFPPPEPAGGQGGAPGGVLPPDALVVTDPTLRMVVSALQAMDAQHQACATGYVLSLFAATKGVPIQEQARAGPELQRAEGGDPTDGDTREARKASG